jgi:hypothetical protein
MRGDVHTSSGKDMGEVDVAMARWRNSWRMGSCRKAGDAWILKDWQLVQYPDTN